MIVVDTSALMAILLEEPEAPLCVDAIESASALVISAGTVTEALIVASGRNLHLRMIEMIQRLGLQVVDFTAADARRVADAYCHWGKGFHKASLNFGDCFAYALAVERNCPLLYVGNDFAQTDIRSAVLPSA